MPLGIVVSVFQLAFLDKVAVGEKNRVFAAICFDPGGEAGENVRPIGIIGDSAESFGFALGTKYRRRQVQAAQAAILCRIYGGGDLQAELVRDVLYRQVLICDDHPLIINFHTINTDIIELQVFSEKCDKFMEF